MNLATDPKIVGLANALGLFGGDPVEEIRNFCKAKVNKITSRVKGVLTMSMLQEVVCAALKLQVHHVWSDEELSSLSAYYVGKGEFVFAALGQQLGAEDYGIFIHLNHEMENGSCCVAIVDCRDEKYFRRHWTLWHEIAHCLTSVGQYQLPLRRSSSVKKDSIEVITDIIAKDLAFYGPVFDPIFEREFMKLGRVTFKLVEDVRNRFCQEASFVATLNACVSCSPLAAVVVETHLGLNKKERAQSESGKGEPAPALRVSSCFQNEAARDSGLWIPSNYRVPPASVIYKVNGQFRSVSVARENMNIWVDSRGRRLVARNVTVEAKRFGSNVIAVVCAFPT